ncbi:MAG: phosphoserine transaminase [Acidimicrobiia bacterium]|nr:phosphoserine transaminase [Acidimicrobiia bacterium]MDH3396926.1 phosphoserine transaminase [Acidimicrobiia bacterium]MDH5614922.1 phosphoserine transaminase [Acidimicrobiia bacterium]
MTISVPDIRIPADLLPADGRFGSGPAKVREEAVADLAAAPSFLGTSHRRPAVKAVVRNIREGLADLFGLPADYEVLLGNGGATAFWDAAALGLIERKSQHLSFGVFSAKFAAAVAGAPHLEAPEIIVSEYGTHPLPIPSAGVDTYALTHNETTTGVRMEIRRPDAPGLVVVDATSAAGALRVDPAEFDVYYFSPQKAFGSDGGLWVAACSGAAVDRIERIGATDRYVPAFLSLEVALENSRQFQTYNTPALATLFLLDHQIEWIRSMGGLEWAASRADRNAAALYEWAGRSDFAFPFVGEPGDRSPVTATIDFDPGVPAPVVASVLRANGIVDTESYRKLGRNQLRIGLWPAIETADVEALTRSIDFVVERLG